MLVSISAYANLRACKCAYVSVNGAAVAASVKELCVPCFLPLSP